MPKKPVDLDGLLDTETRPTDTGIPQRGAEPTASDKPSAAKKRKGEKRLTLALDSATYRQLRMYAAETDQTHQAILETALAEYLNRATT
ncbi:MAG: CopG family transcriptional regulator [Chloroflexi bacterium]|nr:CopG family transcriptional regulator [Chloroflexota bacterium]